MSIGVLPTPLFQTGGFSRSRHLSTMENPESIATVDQNIATVESTDEAATVPQDVQTLARPHLLTLWYTPDTPAKLSDKLPSTPLQKQGQETFVMGRGENLDVLLNDEHMPRTFVEVFCRVEEEGIPKWYVKNLSDKKAVRLELGGTRVSFKFNEVKELKDGQKLKLETLCFTVSTEEGDYAENTKFQLEFRALSSLDFYKRQTSSSTDSSGSMFSASEQGRQPYGGSPVVNGQYMFGHFGQIAPSGPVARAGPALPGVYLPGQGAAPGMPMHPGGAGAGVYYPVTTAGSLPGFGPHLSAGHPLPPLTTPPYGHGYYQGGHSAQVPAVFPTHSYPLSALASHGADPHSGPGPHSGSASHGLAGPGPYYGATGSVAHYAGPNREPAVPSHYSGAGALGPSGSSLYPGTGNHPGSNSYPGPGNHPGSNPYPGTGGYPGVNPYPGTGSHPGVNPYPGTGNHPGPNPYPGTGSHPGPSAYSEHHANFSNVPAAGGVRGGDPAGSGPVPPGQSSFLPGNWGPQGHQPVNQPVNPQPVNQPVNQPQPAGVTGVNQQSPAAESARGAWQGGETRMSELVSRCRLGEPSFQPLPPDRGTGAKEPVPVNSSALASHPDGQQASTAHSMSIQYPTLFSQEHHVSQHYNPGEFLPSPQPQYHYHHQQQQQPLLAQAGPLHGPLSVPPQQYSEVSPPSQGDVYARAAEGRQGVTQAPHVITQPESAVVHQQPESARLHNPQQPESARVHDMSGQQPESASVHNMSGQQPESARVHNMSGQQPESARVHNSQQPESARVHNISGQQPESARVQNSQQPESARVHNSQQPESARVHYPEQPESARMHYLTGQQPESAQMVHTGFGHQPESSAEYSMSGQCRESPHSCLIQQASDPSRLTTTTTTTPLGTSAPARYPPSRSPPAAPPGWQRSGTTAGSPVQATTPPPTERVSPTPANSLHGHHPEIVTGAASGAPLDHAVPSGQAFSWQGAGARARAATQAEAAGVGGNGGNSGGSVYDQPRRSSYPVASGAGPAHVLPSGAAMAPPPSLRDPPRQTLPAHAMRTFSAVQAEQGGNSRQMPFAARAPVATSALGGAASNGNQIHLRNQEVMLAQPSMLPSSDFSSRGSTRVQDLQAVALDHPRQPQENDERQPQEHEEDEESGAM